MVDRRWLLAAALLTAGPAPAQLLPPASKAMTAQTAGGRLDYTESWSELALKDVNGRPQATISTTSYVRQGVAPAQRPVVFVFNGGPGSASVDLNYGLFGPELRVTEGSSPYKEAGDTRPDGTAVPTRFVPNPDTLLDVADLVMVDPVGTGFSRELVPLGGQDYWSTEGDIESFSRCIRDWLTRHGRLGAPIYLAGESYGGFRAGFIAAQLSDLDMAGVILISPGVSLADMFGDPVYPASVPAMAVAAAYHGKVPARGRSTATIYADAERFVETQYLPALYQGTALPAAERDRVATGLSALIGLPARQIANANLRVDTQAFLETLLPGKVVGRLDDRAIGEAPKVQDAARDRAIDDPSLGMSGGNVRVSRPVGDRLRALGVATKAPYVALSLDVNMRWDFRPRSSTWDHNLEMNAGPAYASLMAARPQARLLVVGGYYDLTLPIAAPRYALTRGGIPIDRVTFRAYEAGHTISNDPKARPLLARDIRSFLAARQPGG